MAGALNNAVAALSAAAPTGQPVANGSIQTENVHPANQKAKDNEDRAKGINRELLSERADP
jgi:hypothetical protein